ncbi:hypothetical protein GCM10027046_23020 [Uliginosibacterium flavum]
MRSRLRQSELATILHYEQAYVSAIELGVKPPSDEFMRKLALGLNFTDEDVAGMHQAAEQSQRRYVLPRDVPTETYLLCHQMWKKIDRLYPAQIRAISEMLNMDEQIAREPNVPTRLRRRVKEAAKK